jgi:MtN3 and saliva related transmembrane protein
LNDPSTNTLVVLAGTVAGILSVVAFIPQAWRIFRRKSAADVSLAMYLTLIAASALWMFYAWTLGAMPLFFTNLVIGVIAVLIALLKVRHSG